MYVNTSFATWCSCGWWNWLQVTHSSVDTYRVMHRHLIDQGSAYTLDVNTRFRYMTRVERPLGLSLSLSLSQLSLPKEGVTVPPITKYRNTAHESKLA
jgi:hypothetical protein